MKGSKQCERADHRETVARDLAQAVDDADRARRRLSLRAMELVEEQRVLVIGEIQRNRLRLDDALHVVGNQIGLDGGDMPEHGLQQSAEQLNGERRRDQQEEIVDRALGRDAAARACQIIDDELEQVERRERDRALQDHEDEARHRPDPRRGPHQPQRPIRTQAVAASPTTT